MRFTLLVFVIFCFSPASYSKMVNIHPLSNTALENAFKCKIGEIDQRIQNAYSREELQKVADAIVALMNCSAKDTCLEPEVKDFQSWCADITMRTRAPKSEREYFEYHYEKRLWKMACVEIGIDNEETVKKKIQLFWNKYKTKCKCDSLGFGIQHGNFLKFAVAMNMLEVLDTFVMTYGLDINFIDPADNRNLLDYINAEIDRSKKLENSDSKIALYQQYKESIISLGGKPSK